MCIASMMLGKAIGGRTGAMIGGGLGGGIPGLLTARQMFKKPKTTQAQPAIGYGT